MNAAQTPAPHADPEAMAQLRAHARKTRALSPSFATPVEGLITVVIGRGGSAWENDPQARLEIGLTIDQALRPDHVAEILQATGDQLRWGFEGAPEGPIAESNRFYGVTVPNGSGWMVPANESTASGMAAEIALVAARDFTS